MQAIDELLAASPALTGLSAAQRETVSGCAQLRVFVPGDRIMREGDPARDFFVLRRGAVALETTAPGRGAITLQTLHDGDLIGWSWLVPPYRTAFDARAVAETHAIAIDGACLRAKCDADPVLGYALLRAMATVFASRLHDTRLRLLDLYGGGAG